MPDIYDQLNQNQKELYNAYIASLQEYQNLIKALNSTVPVNDANDKYFGLTEDRLSDENVHFGGIKRNMTEKGANKLEEYAENLFNSAKTLSDSLGPVSSLSVEKRELYKELKENIKSTQLDISMLEGTDRTKLPSYSSMRRDASDITIDVSKGIGTAGGFMSDRKVIRYLDKSGNIQKGFFTIDNYSGATPESIINDITTTCPALTEVLQEIKNFPFAYKKILSNSNFDLDTPTAALNPEIDFPSLLKDYGLSPDIVDRVTWNDETTRAMAMFYHKGNSIEDINAMNKNAGIEDGVTINQRNVAMSDIATQLKLPNIVAKSEPMSIMRDGKLIHGSFMRNAKGYRIEDLDPKSSNFFSKAIEIDYTSMGPSCSDLMVMDYICCNIDRHANNMFYQVVPGKDIHAPMQMKAVQGIDNDTSFGNIVPGEKEGMTRLPPLNSMKFISDKTAKNVLALTESGMKSVLSSRGLTDKETEAAWKRTVLLQNKIKKNQIQILKSNEWTKEKFNEQAGLLKDMQRNPFVCANTAHENYLEAKIKYDQDLRNRIEEDYKNFRKNPLDDKFDSILKKLDSVTKGKFDVLNQKHFNNKKINNIIMDEIRKGVVKEEKDRQILKEREESLKDTVKSLNDKLQMDDSCTLNGQAYKINKLGNKLWAPKDKDIAEYKPFYDKLQEIKAFTADIQKQMKHPPKEKNSNKPSLVGKNGQLTDFGENLIATKFKELDELNQKYLMALPTKLSRNDMKRFAIGSEIHELSVIAMQARERKVDAFNEIMANSYKDLAVTHAELEKEQKKDPNSPETAVAKEVFEAKSYLANFVGQLEEPTNEQRQKVNESIATITAGDMLKDLKTHQPEQYNAQMKAISESGLQQIRKDFLENPTFAKMVSEMKPAGVFTANAEKHLSNVAKQLNVLKDKPIKESKDVIKTETKDKKLDSPTKSKGKGLSK